jgi:hypothetical protein
VAKWTLISSNRHYQHTLIFCAFGAYNFMAYCECETINRKDSHPKIQIGIIV